MTFVTTTTCNQKRLIAKKSPLMLKDYLIDDLSSCSSNGFKSFPRRQQCCTSTVRFLLEIDLKDTKSYTKRRQIQRSSSVLQRASEKIINAVKLLPFTSVKSKSVNKARKTFFLHRSFSRKMLKRSFRRKSDNGNDKNEEEFKEIKRWKLFREYLEEKYQPSDQINTNDPHQTNAVNVVLDQVSVSTSSDDNSENKSNSDSNGNSWVEESEFTKDNNNLPSGNSEVSSENDVVESNKGEEQVSKSVGVAAGNHIESPTTKKEWANEEEKQQFSPLSVLDCPFEYEEDIGSSPFTYRLARMEGSKKKLMQKIRRFEILADQLKPVDLEKRIALSELKDEEEDDEDELEEIHESPNKPRCSMTIYNNDIFDIHNNKDEAYERARELLKVVDLKLPFSMLDFKAEILVLDFLIENLEEMNSVEYTIGKQMEIEEDIVTRIESWVYGRELIMGDGRKIYIEEMEKKGEWRNLDEENNEVVLVLENDIFTCLEEEMLLDFF